MNKIKIFLTILAGMTLVVALYSFGIYISPILTEYLYPEIEMSEMSDLTKVGLFGDSTGMINSFFSVCAFIGVLVTLVLQMYDSKEQKISIKIERFENTFFKMLSLQQEIVKDLSFTYKESVETLIDGGASSESSYVKRSVLGRELFRYFFEDSTQRLRDTNGNKLEYQGMRQMIRSIGNTHYDYTFTASYFDHYFRHLYRIIKFIDETDLLPNDKDIRYKYTSMVRAQLSRYELIWIFYNCLSENGVTKFKQLVENYTLLKNIRIELLVTSEEKDLYNKKCEEGAVEKTTDFSGEYKRIAFVREEQPVKKIKCTLPFILDINIKLYRTPENK